MPCTHHRGQVDDQPLFRAGIRMLIESQEDMELAGEAADGEQALALAAQRRPDVMLMDLRMPMAVSNHRRNRFDLKITESPFSHRRRCRPAPNERLFSVRMLPRHQAFSRGRSAP
jgi:CheY-like chemotaxis protein